MTQPSLIPQQYSYPGLTMTLFVFTTTYVAKLVATATLHVVTALIFLNPEETL